DEGLCFMRGVCSSSSSSPSHSSSKAASHTPKAGSSSSSSKLKASLWSSFFASAFSSVFESKGGVLHTTSNGWTSSVKKIVGIGAMRRIHERVLGTNRTGLSGSTSDIWLLGVCYKISQDSSSPPPPPPPPVDAAPIAATTSQIAAFTSDFSSRILMTYRKGFDAMGDSKLTSDGGWGCMLRSSQMLVAQALLFHRLKRCWRRSSAHPLDPEYVEILHLFGDSEASSFSIHNLLQAGRSYGLAAGSWVGPYAMCRTWEALARSEREGAGIEYQSLPLAVYVVSGDEDGERGGAPVVCTEDASKRCLEFSKGQADWTPILLLVPLVLGLDKVNPRFVMILWILFLLSNLGCFFGLGTFGIPLSFYEPEVVTASFVVRYIPSLQATFTFPQSLGILGGKPGSSFYIIGVQDDDVLYLDPHEVQPVVNVKRDDLEADTSSYHCDVPRRIPLDSIDPSLALGFYCRDKDDFDKFCSLATKLADESCGAPLFTVAHSHQLSKPIGHNNGMNDSSRVQGKEPLGVIPVNDTEGYSQDDDWQLL
ncbi:hypothetical protein Tsubulata_007911, partial [Turnera subulata]